MTAYRLPEALGGGEYEGGFASFTGRRFLMFDLPSGERFYVEESAVTEVKPPLPPEPAIGHCVFVGDFNCIPPTLVFRRFAAGWTEPGRDADAPGFAYLTWADVCSYGTPVRLIADRSGGEPVELPWHRHGVEVQQTTSDTGPGHHVHVSTKDASYGFAHLSPPQARDMARAVWAAADAAEAAS